MTEDKVLLQKSLAGDQAAFDLLISRYLKIIYSVALHYVIDADEASDVAQDAVIKIWKNLKHFNPDKNFKPWAVRIVSNTALDWLKKKKPLLFSALEIEDADALAAVLPDPTPSANIELERREVAQAVKQAVGMLPKEDRIILHLRYELELTFKEIGEQLGKAMETVKSRHARAILKLKTLLDPREF
ncbi:MAG: sigma-70 family RNA polymerase sigma factor [Patescibacteria group bacterium]